MSLKARITADMKSAMKAGEKDRLRTVRLILADIQRCEVDRREELDDTAVLTVIEKAVKQRRDSIEQFLQGGRKDLSAIEEAELDIIKSYLPEHLSEDERRRWQPDGRQRLVEGPFRTALSGRADRASAVARVRTSGKDWRERPTSRSCLGERNC